MAQKFVRITLERKLTDEVIARVDTDLSGVALYDAIRLPEQWFRDYFGDAADEWEIDDCEEISEEQAAKECPDPSDLAPASVDDDDKE
jgi:hypothetical protein